MCLKDVSDEIDNGGNRFSDRLAKRMEEKMQEKKKYIIGKKVLAVLLLAISVLVFQYAAKAESYLLTTTGIHLYAGDSFVLSDYCNKEELEKVDFSSFQYAVAEESEDKDCIRLSLDGKVTAVREGTAIITISYLIKEETEPREENFTVTVLAPEQITASYGETFWLGAFDYYNPYDTESDTEETEKKYTFSYSNNSLALDEDREGLYVQGFQNANVYLEKNEEQILVAEVTVIAPELEESKIARATKTDAFYPVIKNFTLMEGGNSGNQETEDGQKTEEKVVWTIENQEIAAVTEKGIEAMKVGKTKVTAELTAKNGDTVELSLQLAVTDPEATGEVLVMAVGITKKLPITGTGSYSTYRYSGEADSFRYSSLTGKGKLTGESKGKETLKILIDGRIVEVIAVITDPAYKNYKFTMYKGLEKDFKLSGLSKTYSTVTYSTADKNIATITKAGKVTAKKVGVTKLNVTADGKKITVWIEISSKKGYQAAKKGISISKTKTHYSQVKRMSKGYYDCSSLVSRIYRQYGVYFGSKSGWSPVAADIGKWCSNNNKVIAKKGISDTKLVPGDLIFYSYTKNGRYKNISHVEIYAGNGMDVSASSSNNKVIHYGYSPNSVVLIARPTN